MILEGIVIAVGALLIWAAVSDYRSMLIPNWIPLSILGLFAAYQIAQGLMDISSPAVPLVPSLIAGGVTFVVFTILFALNWIGGGDVKLISAMAFWAGSFVGEFIIVMALVGGLVAVLFFFKQTHKPDSEVKIDVLAEARTTNSPEKKEKEQKKRIKNTHIPYGIAISVAGLFVVNKIITILPT